MKQKNSLIEIIVASEDELMNFGKFKISRNFMQDMEKSTASNVIHYIKQFEDKAFTGNEFKTKLLEIPIPIETVNSVIKQIIPLLTVNPEELLEQSIRQEEFRQLYLNKEYETLSSKFIDLLIMFERITFSNLTPVLQHYIDLFADIFLTLFIKPDYPLTVEHAQLFIQRNPVISNIIAMSAYKNTDKQIEFLKTCENNFFKILTLYSARNTVKIPPKMLFDVNPYFASLWYNYYYTLGAYPSLLLNNNLSEHIDNIDDRLCFNPYNMSSPYFIVNYYCPDDYKKVKQKINQAIKDAFQGIEINLRNQPDKKKIAIVTKKWNKTTAVYKSSFDFINALSDDYELILIHLGPTLNNIDTSIFKDAKCAISPNNNAVTLDLFNIDEDIILAYYPDIGMNMESIYLSNLRIAPIQVTSYGHPASTYGSEIDYFIGGKACESIDNAERNYSERLVVIPGIGAYPVYPNYEKKGIKKKSERFIINCPWGISKINYRLMLMLKEIMESANKKILFRFFPGSVINNRLIPFNNELEEILGDENIEVFDEKTYQEYMELMEEGDISLESYPHGGYNTLIDSFYLGKPIVVLEGTKAFNSLNGAVCRRLGLDELITRTENEYVSRAVNLIEDDDYRLNLVNKIKNLDLRAKIFNTDEPKYFKKAIDYLIDNYEDLKNENSKKPIIIE